MGNHSTKPPPSGEPTLIYVAPAARQARESGETSIDSNVEVQGASVFHPAAERFRVGDLLGEGGTSRVFAAFDGDLEREIAIKVVPVGSGWSERQFIREARVTSSLVHPNVLPVYDVGRVEDGYYLVLPRIRGQSLRALIRTAIEKGATSALPPNELVEVILKVCDALAYAHDSGVIHQDIKPENIMLGAFGEVMLVDWGAASVVGEVGSEHPVVGTPSYMSPEQAQGEKEVPLFDVYALGATLFHALLLRKPIDEPDPTRFWERKLKGDLDFPTRQELSKYPRALLAVARRAMHPNPVERYQTIGEFARALRDFVAGGTNWSAPLVSENFEDESWRERFRSTEPEAFEAVSGAIVSRAPLGALLYHVDRLSGGVALEFDGTMLEGSLPGDISAVWTEDDVMREEVPRFPRQGSRTYCFQVGALSNHAAGIFRDFHQPLAVQSLRLEPGRTYRIRCEVDERMLSLSIDGEIVAEYEEKLPFRSGYWALYAYYPGKSFANLRIHQRGLPEYMSPLAIGDAFFAREDYEEAEREYYRVEIGQGSRQLVEEARYKRGLCESKRGERNAAFRLWESLEGSEWAARLDLHRAESCFDDGDHTGAIAILARLFESEPNHRARIVQRFCEWMARLVGTDDRPLDEYLDFRSKYFSANAPSRGATARALLSLGRFEEVVEHHRGERIEYCDALLGLGRFDEIIDEHADMQGLRDATLIRQGRLDLVSSSPRSRPRVAIALGRYEEATATSSSAEALLAAGRFVEVLGASDAGSIERVTAYLCLGDVASALGTKHPLAALETGDFAGALAAATTLEWRVRTLQALALDAFHRGDDDELRRRVEEVERLPFSFAWEDAWFERFFLIPLALELRGDGARLRTSLQRVVSDFSSYWGQRAFHLARFVLGEIDEHEFSSEPCLGGHVARLELGRALVAESQRDLTVAGAAYDRFLTLPFQQRHVDSIFAQPTLVEWARRRSSGRAVTAG